MTVLIPNTLLIRRPTAKKFHLAVGEHIDRTECGQSITNPVRKVVRNARLIDCYDCLTAVVGGAFVR